MQQSLDDDLLTYADVAAICGFKTVQPIRRAIRQRQLRIVKISHKTRRIRRSELERWLAAKTVRALGVPKPQR
jgi:hypothetical protein